MANMTNKWVRGELLDWEDAQPHFERGCVMVDDDGDFWVKLHTSGYRMLSRGHDIVTRATCIMNEMKWSIAFDPEWRFSQVPEAETVDAQTSEIGDEHIEKRRSEFNARFEDLRLIYEQELYAADRALEAYERIQSAKTAEALNDAITALTLFVAEDFAKRTSPKNVKSQTSAQ